MRPTKSFSIGLFIALSVSTAHAAGRKSDEARDTLEDMEISAAAVADEADQLVQISASNQLSAETHITMLNAIKEDVNRMGRQIASLEAERDSLPKWEQRASDKTLPLLKETAENTRKALEYAGENRTRLWMEDYRNYANTIWRDSGQIAKTLKDYLKYAKVHNEEQQLQENLGIGN